MGKKGSKRKTRWRTLSIGAPPGEEDEEEGLRNGFVKSQEKSPNSHSYNRHENGQQGNGGGYKPRRPPFNGNSSGTSGYASSGGSRSHREDSLGSPAQPKIIFNEEEYTRITTPRQDVLFKKGYLSRKKPLASNASTSATPSTTESQSASHSTADGSETTEDQQLLDNGAGEYGPPVDPATQMGYGTFYDHTSGYYYEYPVMLVGPAPVPAQVGPGILAAMPCGPVPLRPIEWVNPAFVPEFSEPPYCMMDYQTGQSIDCVPLMDEPAGSTLLPVENTNETWNENGTGTASCSGSVAEEVEERQIVGDPNGLESTGKEGPQNQVEEVTTNGLENNGCQYVESVMMPQHHPIHVSHHVMPPMPQPSYMYPGHYMFGPSLVNVNGVNIQSGPILRNTDMTVCAKRKKKKKRRKQRKPATGNADEEEDEEEEEYSSEGDNGLSSSSRLSWPGSTNPNTETTTGIASVTSTTTQKPLNPECQEFRLRPIAELQTSPTDNSVTSTNQDEPYPNKHLTSLPSPTNDTPTSLNSESSLEKTCETNGFSSAEITSSSHKDQSTGDQNSNLDLNMSPLKETLEESSIDDSSKEKQPKELESSKKTISKNDQAKSKKSNKNTKADRNSGKNKERLDISVKDDESKINSTTVPINTESQRLPQSYESIITKTSTNGPAPKKKYAGKNQKFVREPTPGPDLNDEQQTITSPTAETLDISKDCKTTTDVVVVQLDTVNNDNDDQKLAMSDGNAECSNNEDSGFESQTVGSKQSDYPITKAVKEWLSRANSPDVFITTSSKIDDSESEMEDDEDDLDNEPSKNLQGNPMPALSANSSVSNEEESLSRTASCGKFARNNNNNNNKNNNNNNNINNNAKVNREGTTESISKVSTRRKKNAKRKSGGDRRNFSQQQSRVKNLNERIKEKSISPKDPTEVGSVVEDVCEFTEEDSVAGMRVALNSRIDSEIDSNDQIKTVNVMKTYEKGEIVVSIDGKVLPTSYRYCKNDIETGIEQTEDKEERENGNVLLDNIEEPDVLECWEVESFEPMVTPKKILQSSGMSYDGEAAEDCLEAQPCIESEYVQKYYRFTRGSVTSLDEDGSSENDVTVESEWKSKSVPNNNPQWIPVVVPNANQMEEEKKEEEEGGENTENQNKTPIDEAFEVYESCYTAKTVPYFTIDPKGLRSRPSLYKLDGDGPIPCKAACCNIQ